MPKILERLVSQLKAKGMSENQAYAVATSQLQKAGDLQKGSSKPTPKGVKRGDMTPAARAKDRAAKYSGKHKTGEYSYDKKTNQATLKKRA
jgi:hypothetical protein